MLQYKTAVDWVNTFRIPCLHILDFYQNTDLILRSPVLRTAPTLHSPWALPSLPGPAKTSPHQDRKSCPGPPPLTGQNLPLTEQNVPEITRILFLTADNIQIPKKSCFNPVYSCSGLVTGRQWPLDRFNSAQTRILPHKWSHLSTHLQNFRKEQYLKKTNLW